MNKAYTYNSFKLHHMYKITYLFNDMKRQHQAYIYVCTAGAGLKGFYSWDVETLQLSPNSWTISKLAFKKNWVQDLEPVPKLIRLKLIEEANELNKGHPYG